MNKIHVILGSNYFFIFLVFGITMPYFSPALLSLGFSKQQIGAIWAGMYVCATLAPMGGGRISDRWLSADRTAAISGLLMTLFACVMWWKTHEAWLLLPVIFLFTTVRAPVVSMLDTLTMQGVAGSPKLYSRIRMVGSIGFAVAVTVFGWMVSRWGYQLFFGATAVACFLFFLNALLLPREEKAKHDGPKSGFWRALSWSWWVWLLALALHWFAFGPYNYGFNLLLEEQGIKPEYYGWFWNIGIVVEVGLFTISGWFFARWSHHRLLLLAMAGNLLRWFILGWYPDPWLIALSQILHGPGFALFYAAALQGIHFYCGGNNRASYQGLFSTCMGLASIGGTWLAGTLHQQMSFDLMIRWFAPIQVAAMIVLFFFPLRHGKREPTA